MPCGGERVVFDDPLSGIAVTDPTAGCECRTDDLRAGLVGNCVLSVTVESMCEQISTTDEGEGASRDESYQSESEVIDPTIFAITGASKEIDFCRITYIISNSRNSTASVTDFSVDGETFAFPTPIAPGNNETVRILRQKPANCEIRQTGIIKATCPNAPGAMTLDKLRVCVLSGAVGKTVGQVF